MNTFPIMLRLEGRLAVVVGAGPIGRRKAAALADAGADVLLVDPTPPADPIEGVRFVPDRYEPAQLTGAKIVFACTDDADLNTQIAADARGAGALANAVDQPTDCDFYSAATIRDGSVVIAAGTGGAAPGLVHMLVERIQRVLPVQLGAFAEAISTVRTETKGRIACGVARSRLLKRITGEEGYAAFLSDGVNGLRRLAGLDEASEE